MIFTTEDLLASIKTRTLVPTSQSTFQDSDLIALANEEQLISCVPTIQKAREKYFMRTMTVPVTAGDPVIQIPERAIGAGAHDLFYLQGGVRTRLTQRKIADVDPTGTGGVPQYFYLKDNALVLWPSPTSSIGAVEVWFYARPNDLVKTTSCGRIDVIAPGASTVVFTLNADLSGSLAVGARVDIVSARAPNRIQAYDAVIQSITGVTVTLLLADCVTGAGAIVPQVGDYLCPAGKTNIPLIPVEFHPVLAQMVSARIVEALGDSAKVESVNRKLEQMLANALSLISMRVEGESIPISNRNGIFSALAKGMRGRF